MNPEAVHWLFVMLHAVASGQFHGKISPSQQLCCLSSQVCKQWRHVAKYHGTVWARISLRTQKWANSVTVLQAATSAGPALKTLDIRGVEKVGTDGLAEVGKHCANLERLRMANLPFVRDAAVISVAEGCRSLTALDASQCMMLSDVAAMSLAFNCSKLTELDLSSAYELTDRGVSALASNLLRLHLLKLGGCNRITDQALVQIGKLVQLKTLDLSATSISNVGCLTPLVLLEWIAVSDCSNITDESLDKLFKGSSENETRRKCGEKLLELSIAGCSKISSCGLASITDGCPRLEILSLSQLNKLSIGAIDELLSRRRSLQHVDLQGCTSLSRSAVKILSRKHQQVAGLHVDQPWPEILDVFVDHKCCTTAFLVLVAAYFAQFPQFWFVVGPLVVAVLIYSVVGNLMLRSVLVNFNPKTT